MKTDRTTTANMILLATLFAALLATPASAFITLDGTSRDPSVVAAGDEVVISANFHENASFWYEQVSSGAYRLEAILEPGDTVTREHATILDGVGEVGRLFSGRAWTANYRVKVHEDAPVGTYQFRLLFRYVDREGRAVQEQRESFTLPVTKEGILLELAGIVTTPAEVRPGDNYVTLETALENAGRKDAKAVELRLEHPAGFSAPYTDDNRAWAGYLAAGEQQALSFTVNVDEDVAPGVHEVGATLTYRDESDNRYEKRLDFPLRVREKPVLVVTASEGELLAGRSGELRLTVRNEGTEKAEAADVRLIKESSQPFSFEARSDFLGTLEPGEEATALFTIEAEPGAGVKEHSFTALLRAKGDSDEGDDNIYTFSREATVRVTGEAPNTLLWLGAGAVLAALIGIVAIGIGRRGRKGRR